MVASRLSPPFTCIGSIRAMDHSPGNMPSQEGVP